MRGLRRHQQGRDQAFYNKKESKKKCFIAQANQTNKKIASFVSGKQKVAIKKRRSILNHYVIFFITSRPIVFRRVNEPKIFFFLHFKQAAISQVIQRFFPLLSVLSSCGPSTNGDMVSRRKILSRSRDDLNMEMAAAAAQEEEEDVWYQREKLFRVSQDKKKVTQDRHRLPRYTVGSGCSKTVKSASNFPESTKLEQEEEQEDEEEEEEEQEEQEGERKCLHSPYHKCCLVNAPCCENLKVKESPYLEPPPTLTLCLCERETIIEKKVDRYRAPDFDFDFGAATIFFFETQILKDKEVKIICVFCKFSLLQINLPLLSKEKKIFFSSFLYG